MKQFTQKLIPFFVLGMILVIFAFGIMLVTYLLLLGAIAGSILYIISWIKEKFFHSQAPAAHRKPQTGRIIDLYDWEKVNK